VRTTTDPRSLKPLQQGEVSAAAMPAATPNDGPSTQRRGPIHLDARRIYPPCQRRSRLRTFQPTIVVSRT